jgi:hypothetical protein
MIDNPAHRAGEPMGLGAAADGGGLIARPRFLEIESVVSH